MAGEQRHVLVLGAGVVGVTSAYYLRRAGFAVTLVERREGPALETSFANGGQISASHAEPWAGPHTPWRILKWLGREEAPLIVRHRWDPDMWRWGLRFLRNCTAHRAHINMERILRVALYSRAELARLGDELGLAFDQRQQGILHIYRNPREYEHACAQAEAMNALGCRREPMDPRRCVELEPALSHAAPSLAGGIYSFDDASGDAYQFTSALAAEAARLGVVFRYGREISALAREGGKVVGVEMGPERLDADAVLVCLGSHTPALLRPLGLRVPIYPAKGYSVTLPVAAGASAPYVSLTDDENKLVFSRLGERLRIAGTAELAGFDTQMNPVRSRVVLRKALELFPDAASETQAEFWTGLRPVTPDSTPIIGPTPVPGLYINSGHGTLGWTMSCGSARLIADTLSGVEPQIPTDGLDLSRYRP